jgi:hypothetical protein
LRMAPGTPGPSGAKAPLEPFPVPQRTLDLRREDLYLRITLCVHEPRATILPRAPPRRARAFSVEPFFFLGAADAARPVRNRPSVPDTASSRKHTHEPTHER